MTPLSRRLTSACLSWQAAERDKAQERAHRWTTAANAFWIGRPNYEELAKLLDVTTVAIEQMSYGYAIFLALLRQDWQRAWKDRRLYSYHRFFEVGRKWKEYEFEPELVWDYLESNFSTRQVSMEIEDNHDPLPVWQRKAKRVMPSLQIMRDDVDAPEEIRELIKKLVERIGLWETSSKKS